MRFSIKNRYFVTLNETTGEPFSRLTVLYLPLIGQNALSLYQMLYIQGKENWENQMVDDLCHFADISIDEFEKAVTTLEQYQLLKTYQAASSDKLMFKLVQPLSYEKFFHHDIFSRAYLLKVGEKQYETVKNTFIKEKANVEEYEDITQPFDPRMLAQWDDNAEEKYQQVKNFTGYEDKELPVDFDYEKFESEMSPFLFPYSQRTAENRQIISQLATVFAIDEETMRGIVARSIDLHTGQLDTEKLRNKCVGTRKVKTSETGKDIHYLPPVEFLYHLQNDKAVSSADKKLLEYLQVDLQMKNEVINVMIENILNTKNNQLNRSYVEKVATTWLRQGIDTFEKATQEVNKIKNQVHKTSKMPDFSASEMETEDIDIAGLRAQLFKEKN